MSKTIRKGEQKNRNNVAWGHIMSHASNPKAGFIAKDKDGRRPKDARRKREYLDDQP